MTWGAHEAVPDRMAVVAALKSLPRRQREVAVLRYIADLSEDEVARTLGVDVGTIKQHASRARTALGRALTNGGNDRAE